ncbi:MFS transporter, partial [Candidatus Bathyarchaeota archaeon]|nr:MFS transporter [Candidatus Bathyarchaeota archaeon]
GLPALFAPAISGYLVDRHGVLQGMRYTYMLVFVCVIAIAVVRWRFLKETLAETRSLGSREIASAFTESLGSVYEAWRSMGREVRYITLVFLLMSFEIPLFQTYYALYAIDVVGVGGLEWGLISAIGTAALIVVGLPVGKLIDRFGRRRSMLVGYLFSTPVLLAFTVARGFTQMALVNVSLQVSTAFFFPALNALRADLIPQDRRGRIMGLMGTLRSLAMVPAGVFFGLLYEVNRAYPYYVGVAVEVLTVAIIVLYVREPGSREA